MIFSKHRQECNNNMGYPQSHVVTEHDFIRKSSQENILDGIKGPSDFLPTNRHGGVHQFDPTRYQDTNTPSTSSLSCSNSFHSNSTGKFHSPAVPSEVSSGGEFVRAFLNNVSDHSSHDGQFSLQATKKILTFDSKPGSLHEQDSTPVNGQHHGSNSSGQHIGGSSSGQHSVGIANGQHLAMNSNGNGVQYGSGGLSCQLRTTAEPIEFQSPCGHRVELSERDVVSCGKPNSTRDFRSQRSKERSSPDAESMLPLNCDRLRPIRQKTKNAVVRLPNFFVLIVHRYVPLLDGNLYGTEL